MLVSPSWVSCWGPLTFLFGLEISNVGLELSVGFILVRLIGSRIAILGVNLLRHWYQYPNPTINNIPGLNRHLWPGLIAVVYVMDCRLFPTSKSCITIILIVWLSKQWGIYSIYPKAREWLIKGIFGKSYLFEIELIDIVLLEIKLIQSYLRMKWCFGRSIWFK